MDLLSGDINWPAVTEALSAVGYDGYLTAEVSPTREYSEMLTFYKEVSAQEDAILKGALL